MNLVWTDLGESPQLGTRLPEIKWNHLWEILTNPVWNQKVRELHRALARSPKSGIEAYEQSEVLGAFEAHIQCLQKLLQSHVLTIDYDGAVVKWILKLTSWVAEQGDRI